ncbi:MAG TPA: hybrid sensor histidine kinase/response regulator [Candidatus Acidoferrales bacterium]|jgi:signal transduction histidine kinase|nr:hybrid sensor histidine kinase/response regulator [Candidatus Acidoferrales bacterium]
MSATADPIAKANAALSELIAATPSPKRRGTLLIVDDEEGPRMSLRVIFKDNFDLLMAEDGPTAIELAQKHDIDVAILDIRMAGMSGIEVLERLRFVRPEIEAIMITAFETTDTIRQALRLRACDYINKPFDIATIRAAVNAAMQRRMLESEIHTSAEKVHELLSELQNQKVEEQIAKTRGDIYASIIHDINGPLTVVSGFIQLLNKKLNRASRLELEDLEFIKERMVIIERQVSNCIEISRRYLGFLRQQAGDSAPTGVHQLMGDLEQLVRVHPSIQENDFKVTPPVGDIAVKINGTDVIQILLNLTVNAFQCSSQPHSVDVGGEILHTPLNLADFKDGPTDRFLNVEGLANTAPLVKFWVRDTGPGIPAEVLPKIFQPYFTTKGPRQGTGLGLNIVQRLVKEGNGALHCHTTIGEGTTFTVYLSATDITKP